MQISIKRNRNPKTKILDAHRFVSCSESKVLGLVRIELVAFVSVTLRNTLVHVMLNWIFLLFCLRYVNSDFCREIVAVSTSSHGVRYANCLRMQCLCVWTCLFCTSLSLADLSSLFHRTLSRSYFIDFYFKSKCCFSFGCHACALRIGSGSSAFL